LLHVELNKAFLLSCLLACCKPDPPWSGCQEEPDKLLLCCCGMPSLVPPHPDPRWQACKGGDSNGVLCCDARDPGGSQHQGFGQL